MDTLETDIIWDCQSGVFEKVPDDFMGTDHKFSDMLGGPRVSECAIPAIKWSYAVVYNKTAFPNVAPSKIAHFFDPVKFPGKRGQHGWVNGNLEMALVADGVSPIDVYHKSKCNTHGSTRAQ